MLIKFYKNINTFLTEPFLECAYYERMIILHKSFHSCAIRKSFLCCSKFNFDFHLPSNGLLIICI